jgi:predicted transcriptional regulator
MPAGVSTAVQARLPTETLTRLDALAAQSSTSRSVLLRLAVDEYLANHTEDWVS